MKKIFIIAAFVGLMACNNDQLKFTLWEHNMIILKILNLFLIVCL
jgi:hypothetical protein